MKILDSIRSSAEGRNSPFQSRSLLGVDSPWHADPHSALITTRRPPTLHSSKSVIVSFS